MLKLFKKNKKEKLPARLRGNSCLNCNVPLEGEENFCPNCGQRNNINQLSFKLFVEEFFGDVFSYDSRLWGTVFPLILKPGKVAYEFVSGKRKNLVNPFRTYLTVSLIFFLVYGLINTFNQYNDDGSKNTFFNFNNNDNDDGTPTTAQKDSVISAALLNVKNNSEVNIDSTLAANNINLDSLDLDQISVDSLKNEAKRQNPFFNRLNTFYDYYKENKEHSPKQALDSLGYENTFWNRFYYDKAQSSYNMMEDKGEGFNEKIFSGLSLAIFLLLPVFALFLKLIYIRRKYTYMEHMVFVFYTQAVFFLLMLLFLLVYSFSNGKDGLIAIALGLFLIYLFLAMKKFYNQGWIKTFLKFLMANFSFMFIATFGLAILAVISFIFY